MEKEQICREAAAAAKAGLHLWIEAPLAIDEIRYSVYAAYIEAAGRSKRGAHFIGAGFGKAFTICEINCSMGGVLVVESVTDLESDIIERLEAITRHDSAPMIIFVSKKCACGFGKSTCLCHSLSPQVEALYRARLNLLRARFGSAVQLRVQEVES